MFPTIKTPSFWNGRGCVWFVLGVVFKRLDRTFAVVRVKSTQKNLYSSFSLWSSSKLLEYMSTIARRLQLFLLAIGI